MILRSPLSIPPNPLAGPRKIGDDTDYIELDPANGQINTAGAAAPLTIANLLLDLSPRLTSGDFTAGLFGVPDYFGSVFLHDYMWAVPCVLPYRITVSHLRVRVDTGQAGAKAMMGLYASNASKTGPGSLLAATSEFTPTASAHYQVTLSSNQTIGPGIYWLAYTTDTASITLERAYLGSLFVWKHLESGTGNKGVSHVKYTRAYDSSMPTTFDATPTFATGQPPLLLLVVT